MGPPFFGMPGTWARRMAASPFFWPLTSVRVFRIARQLFKWFCHFFSISVFRGLVYLCVRGLAKMSINSIRRWSEIESLAMPWKMISWRKKVVHIRFGNLVSIDSWNVLWINEGFATFFEYMCVDYLYPSFSNGYLNIRELPTIYKHIKKFSIPGRRFQTLLRPKWLLKAVTVQKMFRAICYRCEISSYANWYPSRVTRFGIYRWISKGFPTVVTP